MIKAFLMLTTLCFLTAQDISVYGSYGIAVHLGGGETSKTSIEDLNFDVTQSPAISDFYDSGVLTEFGVAFGLFNTANKNRRRGHIIIGFNYSFDSMEVLDSNDRFILGKDLEVTTAVPYIGYSFYRRGRYKNGSYYVIAGPAFSKYEGTNSKSDISEVEGAFEKVTFDDNTGIFIGAGFISKFSDNLAMDIGSSIIFRETKPLYGVNLAGVKENFNVSNNLEDFTIKLKIGLLFNFLWE